MTGNWIVAVFPSRAALTSALDHVSRMKDIHIRRAAIVARAESGEVTILGDDIGADEGGIAGGTLALGMTAFGMVQLGALALPGVGPIIVVTGALVGALVGNLTGRIGAALLTKGDKYNSEYAALAAELRAGHPALVLDVRDAGTIYPVLRDVLAHHRAEVLPRERLAAPV
jgi:hypothetical protein